MKDIAMYPETPNRKILCVYILLCFLLSLPFAVQAQQLRADFETDRSGGCSPVKISFTNTTQGAGTGATYRWDFDNGNTSDMASPAAIFSEEREYTVKLTVTSGGQVSSQTKRVTVYKKPVADFTISAVKGCLPFNVTFTSTSSPGSGSYMASHTWDFGDGSAAQTYSNKSTNHTYSLQQKATVSLTVTNEYGCYSFIQKKDIVEILPAITAEFEASKEVLCKVSDPVSFTNTSTGPGTLSYTWNFGDGNTSTEKDPSHSFNKKGNYTVSLTTKNTDGCSITKTRTDLLNVANYKTDFEVPALICEGSSASFNNTSAPYNYYNAQWLVNGEETSWYGGTLYRYFNTAGTYNVKLRNVFGTCPDSAEKIVTVRSTPKLDGFIADLQTKCGAPTEVKFKDTTAGATKWKWAFDYRWDYSKVDATTQSGSYTYSSNSSYPVRLEVANTYGCTASTLKYVTIESPRIYVSIKESTGKNPNNNCGAFDVTFNAYTYGADEIAGYLWDFGDGTTSAAAEPKHTFSNPGSYAVTLNYTTKNGCKGRELLYSGITVYNPVKLQDFTASTTTPCGNNPVYFSVQLTGDYSYLNWEYGDGFGNSSNHSYSQEGTYTVRLVAGNPACSDEMTKKDYIKVQSPFPRISGYTNTCDGTRGEVTLTQNSVNATSVIWNFGDGTATVTTPGNQSQVKHTYTKTGVYTVSLTAVNGACSVGTSLSGVYVYLKQKVTFTADKNSICNDNEELKVTVSTTEKNPYNETFYWSYNSVRFEYSDGTPFNGYRSVDDYRNFPYSATLSRFDPTKTGLRAIITSYRFGCEDTSAVISLKIKNPAQAGFETINNKTCYNSPILFRDTSKANGAIIKKWEWNFGDGVLQTDASGGKTISHKYESPGYYYVSLKLTDDAGCTNSYTSTYQSVEVSGPKAAFSTSGSDVKLNTTVYFYNYTQNTNSYNTIYKWEFGNGATSTEYWPNYTYTVPGTYTIKLTATDTVTKCTSSATQQIVVRNFNSAFAFSTYNITNTSCPPVLANFTNTSYNYNRVTWDFGDGFTADNLNYASHVYEKPGKYIITLNVYADNDLKGTYIDSVIITQPSGTIKATPAEICAGQAVTLNATMQNSSSFVWDLGDGNIMNGTAGNTVHNYNIPGTYKPAVLLTNEGGCTSLAALNDKIKVRDKPNVTITPNDPLICKGASVQLEAKGGTVYSWQPPANSSLNSTTIATPIATPQQTTTYTVKVVDDLGCENQNSVTVKVAQPIQVKVTADTPVCTGTMVQLAASGATTYKWINTTAGLNSTTISNPVVKAKATNTYSVAGFDEYNCFSDTAHIEVRTLPLPVVDAGADVETMAQTAIQLNATGSNDIVKWAWSPAQYLNCTNCQAPTCTPMSEIDYTVTVKNADGCTASDMVHVKLLCDEQRVKIPNAFTPNQDGSNDVFIIKGIGMIKHLTIFDRWGHKVYDKSNVIAADRSTCWNGMLNGQPLPSGVYVYFAEMQCATGEAFVRKGTITLLR